MTADAGVAIGPSWPAATLTRTAASSRPLMLPSLAAAAESAGRFHLLPIDRAVTTGERGSLGRPFRRRDEDVEVTSREAVTARDPDAAGRGLRAHNRLQNRLSDLVEAAGYIPIDAESPIDPAFDLAWFDGPTLFVVEVKSCTQDNQTQQLRLGIGQVLDYEDTLLPRGYTVQPVLYLEQQPADMRWSGLTRRHGIQLILSTAS